MKSRKLITGLGLSIALIVSGCANLSDTARKRGAYDFNCPQDQVAVNTVPGGSFAVTGCGKSTTYKCWRTGMEPQCIQEKDIPKG